MAAGRLRGLEAQRLRGLGACRLDGLIRGLEAQRLRSVQAYGPRGLKALGRAGSAAERPDRLGDLEA